MTSPSFVSKLFLPAAFVASALLSAAPAQARATVSDTWQDFDLDATLTDCNGEDIQITLHVREHFHAVHNDNTNHLESQVIIQGLTGEGSDGNTYIFSEESHFGENIAFGVGLGAEETITDNIRFIAQGTAPDFVAQVLFHITINANGTVTSSIDEATSECR